VKAVSPEPSDEPDNTRVDQPEIPAAALGEFLREARARGGLTLERIAQETKIPVRHLVALERGNLDAIPGGLYQRAEVRAYAQAVGLSQSAALGRLDRVLAAASQPDASQLIEPRRLLSSQSLALAVLGVVTAVFLSVQIWGRISAVAEPADSRLPTSEHVRPASAIEIVAPPETNVAPELTPDPVGENSTADAAVEIATEPAPLAPSVSEGLVDAGLVVTTDPEGASVTVDGIGRGSTPATVLYLNPGNRVVRVTKEGFAGEERAVLVTGHAPSALHISLVPISETNR
jgi:cytoskeletal protein RodZ